MYAMQRVRSVRVQPLASALSATSCAAVQSSIATAAAAPLPSPIPAIAPYIVSSRTFHSNAVTHAAPASKAAGKGGAAAAAAAPTGPPAPGTPQYENESWSQESLVPTLREAVNLSGDDASSAATEASLSNTLPTIHAEIREHRGSKTSRSLRQDKLRVPGCITDRAAPRQNQLLISLDRFELEKICRTFRRSVGHKVMWMQIEGQAEPVKVIPEEIARHPVTQEILSANFFLFKPFQEKIKVHIPIVYTGMDECIGVKRGGVVVISRETVPCIWTGGDNIPPFLHINLTNADGGKVFRNADLVLPPHLRLHNPRADYVLASVVGVKSRSMRETAEDGAAAATTAAATPAAPSAAKLEKEKKEKERKEEEEMVAQKLAQKGAKKK